MSLGMLGKRSGIVQMVDGPKPNLSRASLKLIPKTGSHFWFGCGVPLILARSLQNGTKNSGDPL